jgi:hypothetical protein
MTRNLLLLPMLFCLTLVSAPAAMADYYKYTDAAGGVNITNKLDAVPQKYRSRVKVITDDTLTKKDTGARKALPAAGQEESGTPTEAAAPAVAAAPAPGGKFAQFSARHVWFTPLLYLAGIFALLLAVIKLASVVPSPQLSKMIYLSFFIGVSVFLYKAYVEHVVADSLAVKEKAVTMMKKSMVREPPSEDAAGVNK